jgi:hypothetical protein
MVVERNCNVKKQDAGTAGGTISGGVVVGGNTEYCGAVKQERYEIQSVVDYHDEHDGTHCVVVSEDGVASTDGAKHISEFESSEVPEWVSKIQNRAKNVVGNTDAEMLMAQFTGPEIPLSIATSESEYNVVFTRISSQVVEA